MRSFCMAGHGVRETGLSDLGPSNQHTPHSILHGINHLATSYIDQQESGFNFGGLEEAIVYQGIKSGEDEAKKTFFTTRPAATLEMFPSWPLRFQQTHKGSSTSGGESTDSGSAQKPISCKIDGRLESESPTRNKISDQDLDQKQQQKQLVKMASDVSRTGPPPNQQPKTRRKGAGSTSDKPLDAKTLRRLAQNREAARKSRLRKKAYVQQLESSRLKLSQLEQDLQRARSQGLFIADGAGAGGNLSTGAAMFDMEYARWLDEDRRHVAELQTALQAHVSDNDLRLMLDGYLAHYDEIFRQKGVAAKSDVFHLITGIWATSAERCFNWMGGFRPSDLLKMLMPHLDPLTEQQLMGICSLQQSSQQAEEALSQGLEQLHVSLSETIASGPLSEGTNVQNYMGQMALALSQISNLEGFVRQADNLRQQTLHQLRRILTVRQAARCFLAIGEYYNRLRVLSSIWASRPRESMISEDTSCQTSMDFQVVQTPRNHFSNF